tara:strand:- start:5563 stop:6693 length:1131 start_codon:yes stop_codon:yes gene_type:complete
MDNKVHVVTVPRSGFKGGQIFKPSENIKVHYTRSDKYYKLFEYQPKRLPSQLTIYGLQKIGSLVWYDDNAQFWYKNLKRSILSILNKFPDSIIISTGSPFQACYHTMRICEEINNEKYILDFQDPWSIDPYKTYSFNWMKDKVKNFEDKTLSTSKNNIYVTNGLKVLMEKTNANCAVIENGHDFIKPNKFKKENKSKKIVNFIYLGTLANGRDKIFINFLNKLILKGNENFKIDVFGRSSRFFKNWAKKNCLNKISISFKNPINRSEISLLAMNYNFGLQLNSEDYPYLVSTKIYEYPALGLPVLSINGGGEIETIINNSRIGFSVNIKEKDKFSFDEILSRLEEVENSFLYDYSQKSSWISRAKQLNSYLNDTFK